MNVRKAGGLSPWLVGGVCVAASVVLSVATVLVRLNFGVTAVWVFSLLFCAVPGVLNLVLARQQARSSIGWLLLGLYGSYAATALLFFGTTRSAGESGVLKAVQSGEPLTVEQVVEILVAIYSRYPEGLHRDHPAATPVRAIGQSLHDAGGMGLMLQVHDSFASRSFFMKRNLEMVWDGIGEWHG